MNENEKKQIGDKIGSFEIVGTKDIIHGKFFRNTDQVQMISLKGKRGAKATAFVNKFGEVGTYRYDYGYFEGTGTIDGTK
jgi:hypothetical protein